MTTDTSVFEQTGQEIRQLPVHINYEIIHLFSEGLYKSPHKAIEELVTNGYDANANAVHIILPELSEDGLDPANRLWVIDNGHGMDEDGFRQLWRIAESEKSVKPTQNGRPMIGQFGIGKLASYVLAWNLTHVSRTNGRFLLTSMNFRQVHDLHISDDVDLAVSLREIDERTARSHLKEIETRDPAAWRFMFGEESQIDSWTAATLTDFKDLYDKLRVGTLRWVLSTGLPLHTDFNIWLNGERLTSSKEKIPTIDEFQINTAIDGIGAVKGEARICERTLDGGKSDQINRSRGFFIRVRGRVINLEDELFGLEAQNHSAWSRFSLEVDAEGLREHLLSSREGVRDSESVRQFRNFLRREFNRCRSSFEKWNNQQSIDITQLLSDNPSFFLYDPILLSVRKTLESGSESFYVGVPVAGDDEDSSEWFANFEEQVKERPFQGILFEDAGINAPTLRYDPNTRNLFVNDEHPFIDKLRSGPRGRATARLFASSEALLEGQLTDHGIERVMIASILDDRDKALRLVAGNDKTPTAREVIRRLQNATVHEIALERAVGAVFQLIGFEYDRKGGYAPGPDGILDARLGRHRQGIADYRLVYDAKQSNDGAIAASEIDPTSMNDFIEVTNAEFGFFIAEKYQAENDPDGKLNRKLETSELAKRITLLKASHLTELARLHYAHGITLSKLRDLFENAHFVWEIDEWIECLEQELIDEGQIPLRTLLLGLEKQKDDYIAQPNIFVLRQENEQLRKFEPGRLKARLLALESIVGQRWIEINPDSLEVEMHNNANEILKQLERNVCELDNEIFDSLSTNQV